MYEFVRSVITLFEPEGWGQIMPDTLLPDPPD